MEVFSILRFHYLHQQLQKFSSPTLKFLDQFHHQGSMLPYDSVELKERTKAKLTKRSLNRGRHKHFKSFLGKVEYLVHGLIKIVLK